MSSEESQIRRAAHFLAHRLRPAPKVAVILGSGLGDLDLGPESSGIPYASIPGFPQARVLGHPGRLSQAGPAAVLRGRLHFYEGRPMAEVVRPVRILAELGVRTLILTNASGSIVQAFRPGDLMLLVDHLNLMGENPLRGGAHFVDLSQVYDKGLILLAREAARRLRIPLRTGIYAAMPGPTYETPAEVRMLKILGAHAVGMSTVPEALAARQAGLAVLGVSILTNRAAGLSKAPLSHSEVLEAARRSKPRLAKLLRQVLAGIAPEKAQSRARRSS